MYCFSTTLVAMVMQVTSQVSSWLTACEERLLASCIARGQHSGAVGSIGISWIPGSYMGLGYCLTGFPPLPKHARIGTSYTTFPTVMADSV